MALTIAMPATSDDALFNSYALLTENLCEQVSGVCVLNPDLTVRGARGNLDTASLMVWLTSMNWLRKGPRSPIGKSPATGYWLTIIALQHADGELLGALGVQQRCVPATDMEASAMRALLQRLRPILDSLHRELSALAPQNSRAQTLTERTAELEWLFKITSTVRSSSDDQKVLDGVLSAATNRVGAAIGVLVIPDKRMRLECRREVPHAESLQRIAAQTETHLMTWAARQKRPLLINGGAGTTAHCKIMSVPMVRESGRLIGIMAFFNASDAPDFAPRHVFLTRHLGRQMAALVDSQFDLMTGLYTRDGAEQMFARLSDQGGDALGSVIYVDVDHMHVVNELHGFELGNELIVRVAELLTPPIVTQDTICARISGDRFALVMPGIDSNAAVQVAHTMQSAARKLKIGPSQDPVDVSLSCGVAALVGMPQGLARALAAAELACKGAKKHGRNRVEMYACQDDSMMRRHNDVVAIGKLRTALRTDGLTR
jgi:diguanylate cyclase (GGDEF)-like protein